MTLSTSSFTRSLKFGRSLPASSGCYWMLNYYNPNLNVPTFEQEWNFTQSVIDNDGNIFSIGLGYTQTGTNAFITKTASNGLLVWSKTFEHPSGYSLLGNSIALDSLGNIVITIISDNNNFISKVLDGHILKIDPNGSTIIWQTAYKVNGTINGTTYYTLNKIVVDSIDNLYVGFTLINGSSPNTQCGLLKYDTNGILQWQRMLNNPPSSQSILYNLGVGPDLCPVIGYSYQYPGNPGIIKFDTDGNELWHNELAYPSASVYLTESLFYIDNNNDIFLSVYYNYILKISSTGSKLIERSFTNLSASFNFPSIEADISGNIYLVIDVLPLIYVFKLDSSLNLLWENKLSFSDPNYAESPGLYSGYEPQFMRVKNNALYITGSLRIDNFGSGLIYTGMIAKFPLDQSLNGTYSFITLNGSFTYENTTDWSVSTTSDFVLSLSSRMIKNTGGTTNTSLLTNTNFVAYNYPSVISCSDIASPGPLFPMTLVFDTSLSATNEIELPFNGLVNVVIDWGDTNVETVTTTGYKSHTYATNGIYTVTITGSVSQYGGTPINPESLISVLSWGLVCTDYFYAFSQCVNLTTIPPYGPPDAISLSAMFLNCSSLNAPVGSWDVSTVQNMSYMFQGCTSFNQPMGYWDVSNVTNMEGMFYFATSFNQNISDWDVSNVTNMSSMFEFASSFNSNISNWNTSSLTDMSYMFSNASSFNQSINAWNISNVTTLFYTFQDATAFNQPLNSWNTSSVTNMEGTFTYASSFNQPLNSWNTANVTTMSAMFQNASSFNQTINSWNTGNVTDMSYMFEAATAFNQPLVSWDTSKVTDMRGMFIDASAFNQNIGTWNTGLVQYINGMFNGATSFNQDIASWNTASVLNMSNMFNGATAFNQSLNPWTVSSVTNMSGMFNGAINYNQPMSNWNVSSVTNMNLMFFNATVFNQNISNWCVTLILSEPFNFSVGSPLTAPNKPVWGTCPS